MQFAGPFKLAPGDAPPAFSLPGVDGKTYSLDTFKDARVLVVAWWCNHCPYVQAWEQRTIDYAGAVRDAGVQVVAVNSNDVKNYPTDDLPFMKERAAEKGYTFPYLFDETQEAARAFGAVVTPHYFVFVNEGGGFKLTYQGRFDDAKEDPRAAKSKDLEEAVTAALTGNAPAAPSAPVAGCSVKWKA